MATDVKLKMAKDVTHLSMSLVAIWVVFFGEMSTQVIFPFFNWGICLLSCRDSLYILDTNPLSDK